ncbi:MAG: hypothetical protein KDJ74_16485 [Notoacmeibacter sp.]|nr:hypothetical protein [Notoacmeibacter sp.]
MIMLIPNRQFPEARYSGVTPEATAFDNLGKLEFHGPQPGLEMTGKIDHLWIMPSTGLEPVREERPWADWLS